RTRSPPRARRSPRRGTAPARRGSARGPRRSRRAPADAPAWRSAGRARGAALRSWAPVSQAGGTARRCQTCSVKVPRGVVALVVIAALAGAAWLVAQSADAPASGGPAPASGGSAPGQSIPGQSIPVPAGARSEVVEYVHDGDTLFLEDGTKVRLLGVDTPEIGEHAECYGDEARALLRELLPEGTRVRVVADVQPLDQYGRALLFLFTDDDRLVNLELI